MEAAALLFVCLYLCTVFQGIYYLSIPLLLPPCCPGPVASLILPSPLYPGACLTVIRLRFRLKWDGPRPTPAVGWRGKKRRWEDSRETGCRAFSSCCCCHLGGGWGVLVLPGLHRYREDNAQLHRLAKWALPASSCTVCSLSPQLSPYLLIPASSETLIYYYIFSHFCNSV